MTLWKKYDYRYKNYILNGHADDLYDYYNNWDIAKMKQAYGIIQCDRHLTMWKMKI